MTRIRKWTLLGVAALCAALFIRLGFWQLDRRAGRLALEAAITARGDLAPLDWTGASGASAVPMDTAGVIWRRARVVGRYDRAGEVVLRGRSSPDGRPGVEVLTPLEVGGAALMVIRGWLPAPDALRPDLEAGWPATTPHGEVVVEGLIIPRSDGRGGRPVPVSSNGGEHLALAGADLDAISHHLGYRVYPFVLQARDDGLEAPGLGPPRALDRGNGPHLSYALQWFSFAVISVAGTAAVLRKEGRR